ncbi:MAG: 50S ribosomal protein L32 [Phycisphaerae bacterium]|jgi:large subunit ribosomal protein L32
MLPVKKISRTRTRSRRAHHALKPVNYSVCGQCGQSKLPHSACGNCGYLNSKISIDLSAGAND